VFVFFVSLECTDDSTLLENTLKEMFQAQRSSTGTEYYDLRNLKALFEEQDARGVLEKMKERIRAVIAGLVFLFTLQVTIYTANDVYGNRDGISVTFTREVMPVEGRKNDQVCQTMISENMVLAEENQVLGKRAREQEEVLARRADRIAELERANEALERDNEEMRKRLKLANEVVVLQP
jgi:predicted NBD/HSP70 family sugar kinase